MTRHPGSPEGGGPGTGLGRSFGPTAPSDPFQLLVAEHALLRQDLDRVLRAASRAELPPSEGRVDPFLARFRLHVDREDDVLAPICERLFGGKEGAAAVMRREHVALRKGLGSLGRVRGPRARPRGELERLKADLESHFLKEERVLFPLMAALLSSRETASLARRLRGTPVARARR